MILLFWQITGANLTRGKRDAHKHFFLFFRFSALRSQWMRLIVDEQPLTCHPSAAGARTGSLRPDPDSGWKTLHSRILEKEFEAKLIWHCCFMKSDCIFFFLFTRMLQPFELRSQPVPLLHMRIAVQTHFGGLCSTAQPPVKKGCSDLRATAITFHLPAQPLRTLHDFRSCCLVCFYSLSHESCRDVLLFGPVFHVSVFLKGTIGDGECLLMQSFLFCRWQWVFFFCWEICFGESLICLQI